MHSKLFTSRLRLVLIKPKLDHLYHVQPLKVFPELKQASASIQHMLKICDNVNLHFHLKQRLQRNFIRQNNWCFIIVYTKSVSLLQFATKLQTIGSTFMKIQHLYLLFSQKNRGLRKLVMKVGSLVFTKFLYQNYIS